MQYPHSRAAMEQLPLCAGLPPNMEGVLQPQQAGPMMPLLAQPPLPMALLNSSFNIWTTLTWQGINQLWHTWRRQHTLHAPPPPTSPLRRHTPCLSVRHTSSTTRCSHATCFGDMPSGQGNGLFHERMSPLYGHHLNDQIFSGQGQWKHWRYKDRFKNSICGRTTFELHKERGYILCPFSGFHKVRLVNKESRYAGRYNLLCFVDFATPSEARAALETLQVIISYS